MKDSTASGAVAMDELVKTLAKKQTEDLDIIADQLGDSDLNKKVTKSEDITNDFLQIKQVMGPHVPESRFLVYRGLIHALFARTTQCEAAGTLGIMAGDGNAVLEVCITQDLAAALACEELRSTWKAANYQIMGLVAWETNHMCQKFTEAMATLLSLQDDTVFILLLCDRHGQTSTWEFNSEHNPGDFTVVNLNNQSKKRRKNQNFKIFNLDQAVVFEIHIYIYTYSLFFFFMCIYIIYII